MEIGQMDRHVLKMYQSLEIDIDQMILEFTVFHDIAIEQIDWHEFDLYVAKRHNYKLEESQ